MGLNQRIQHEIRGTSDNNIFIVADHGNIFHFNGQDWGKIHGYEVTDLQLVSVMPFEGEIFVLGLYNSKSYVLHGKLK